MGTTADKLSKLLNTKQEIKQAIKNKGVDIDDSTKFADYPSKIDSIMAGDSESVWNLFTNNGKRMEYLFYNCSTTETLDLSHLDTSKVTNMSFMFFTCARLTTLDLSNFNTSKVTNMSNMFRVCQGLTTLDLSNFDTTNVTDMMGMFDNCKSLTTLDVSNFDTSNVTNMSSMFSACYNLTSIDLSNFDTSKVTNMSSMFSSCSKLTTITGLNNFDTSQVTSINYMFSNCSNLITLDVSNFDVSKVASSSGLSAIFNNCPSLVDLYPPKNIGANMDMSKSTALSHDSLVRIINNLMTTTSTRTLTLGATNLAKLTDEEKAIATGKGWTIK